MKPQEGLLLEKSYQIPYALFKAAFTAFQKKFVYPKSYFLMALFSIAAGIYLYVISTGSARPEYFFALFICLAVSFIQWYNPRKIRRNLLLAVREIEQDSYRLRIYPEYLEIGTMLPPESPDQDDLFDDEPEEDFSGTRIYYNKHLHLTEQPDFFMLYLDKTMFYVIPKAVFSEEELEIMRIHFGQKLDKNFT